MILWTLRGYSDPEGEFQGGEIVCAIEKSEDGYRLLVEHNGEVQIHESHGRIETARGKDPFIVHFHVSPEIWLPMKKAIPIKKDELWQHLSFTKGYDKGSSERAMDCLTSHLMEPIDP